MSDKTKKILEDAEREGIPVFVLIAKDNESVGTLQRYLDDCEWDGCSDEHIEGIKSKIAEFEQWQVANLDKVKLPD